MVISGQICGIFDRNAHILHGGEHSCDKVIEFSLYVILICGYDSDCELSLTELDVDAGVAKLIRDASHDNRYSLSILHASHDMKPLIPPVCVIVADDLPL